MTPVSPTATLDVVDRGFLRRLAERARTDRPVVAVEEMDGEEMDGEEMDGEEMSDDAEVVVAEIATAGGAAEPRASNDELPAPTTPGPDASLVERLIHAAPQAWHAIATRVEDAHRAGASVIAVAGGRRGEGRTTIVQCLARTLSARGHRVEVHDRPPVDGSLLADRGRDPIVLIDAGIWFAGGPLRRGALERASLGCHAAILVRRAGQPECAARGAAIEAVGLRLLGEVLTMVPIDAAEGPNR